MALSSKEKDIALSRQRLWVRVPPGSPSFGYGRFVEPNPFGPIILCGEVS